MARTAGASIIDYLDDVEFPTTKGNILEAARDNNAPDEVLDQIMDLPDVEFIGLQDITAGAGQWPSEENPGGDIGAGRR